MRFVPVRLTAALIMAPLGARGLVASWQKRFYPQADEALTDFLYQDGEGKYLPALVLDFDYRDIVLR